MIWNNHYSVEGQHAFLSASKYNWINYDDEKLDASYLAHLAAERGTRRHKLAQMLISEGEKLPRTTATLNLYVNDAIGFKMRPEQPLFYSENVFGTPDAISFHKNLLRIHDLKTGILPTSFNQLLIYCALFCLEYRVNPFEIKMEARIYQNDAVQILEPDPDDVMHIMEKIKRFDKRIKAMRLEALN